MAPPDLIPKPTTSKPKRKRLSRRMTKHNSSLLTLPNEIFLMVTKNLNKYDQQSLALTCKHMTAAICQGETNVIDGPNQNQDMTTEFFLRLHNDWVPHDLKWCHHCGKFQSRDKRHWQELAEKHKDKSAGVLSAAWHFFVEDGTVGQLADDWCHPKALRINSVIKTCPKCKISMARFTIPQYPRLLKH